MLQLFTCMRRTRLMRCIIVQAPDFFCVFLKLYDVLVHTCTVEIIDSSALTAGWCTAHRDSTQWIEADLLSDYEIHDVITQSRAFDWVTSYRINISSDGVTWTQLDAVYMGNTAFDTKVTNSLPAGTVARYVRLVVLAWHGYPCLRWELVGCAGERK